MGLLSFEVLMGKNVDTPYPVKWMTVEQMDVYEEYETIFNLSSKDEARETVQRYSEFLARAHYAGNMFPCKAAVGNDCVRGCVTSAISNMMTKVTSKIDTLIDLAEKTFDVEFSNELTSIYRTVYVATKHDSDERWEQIKWDMCPEHILKERYESAHESALRMNAEYDRQANFKAIYDTLTPEQRKMLERNKDLIGAATC